MFYYLIIDGVRQGPYSRDRAAGNAVLAEERGHQVELYVDAKTSVVRDQRIEGLVRRIAEIKVERKQRPSNRGQSQNS